MNEQNEPYVPPHVEMDPQAFIEENRRLTSNKKPDLDTLFGNRIWPVFAMGPDEQTFSDFVRTSIKARGMATWHVVAAGPSARFIVERGVPEDHSVAINGTILACKPAIWLAVDPMAPDVIEDVEGKVISYGMTAMTPFNRKQEEGYPRVPRVMFGHHISPEPDDVRRIRASSELWWHYSSTHAGLEVARACGARTIVLWGADYGPNRGHAVSGKSGDYVSGYAELTEDKIFGAWQRLAAAYRNFHVRVVNASPESKLRCFDKIDPEDAIRGRVPPAFVGT